MIKNRLNSNKLLITVPIAVLFFVVIIFIAVSYYKNLEPLKNYNFDNCKIGIYNADLSGICVYLTEDEKTEFLAALKNRELNNFGNTNYKEYVGPSNKCYQIALESGEKIDIAPYGKYLIINGKGYVCDDATLAKLDEFRKNHIEEINRH